MKFEPDKIKTLITYDELFAISCSIVIIQKEISNLLPILKSLAQKLETGE